MARANLTKSFSLLKESSGKVAVKRAKMERTQSAEAKRSGLRFRRRVTLIGSQIRASMKMFHAVSILHVETAKFYLKKGMVTQQEPTCILACPIIEGPSAH